MYALARHDFVSPPKRVREVHQVNKGAFELLITAFSQSTCSSAWLYNTYFLAIRHTLETVHLSCRDHPNSHTDLLPPLKGVLIDSKCESKLLANGSADIEPPVLLPFVRALLPLVVYGESIELGDDGLVGSWDEGRVIKKEL